ncbi:RNA polymerase sigma factor [Sphingobacterium sp. SGR-19]|uniref:RNA polymerase sigma factor n=1 Tax=Sphingobacterium sp. SGR-19 TaxID=2710886 RepID=UPI0013ED8872|nr:RNA polymerase sigma-70 factor [Sphingobacterium sp. SGR-19]NGM65686.1 RNA polymerase sigma-70 factor [Sphingobacterium sp. SGR-19]
MAQIINTISDVEFADFKTGDHKAFRRVFDAYHKPIYNYAYKFCKNHEEAEELVQEVFVSLFLHRDKIESPDSLYAYLFIITKRITISIFRKKVVKSKFAEHLKYSWKEACRSTEHTLDMTELTSVWTNAIERLPEKQREVYTLNKINGLSYEEIADKIGVSKYTVKNQLITASKTVKLIVKNIYLLLFLLKNLF